MTTDGAPSFHAASSRTAALWHGIRHNGVPVAVVSAVVLVLWMAAALIANQGLVLQAMERAGQDWSLGERIVAAATQKRPVVPTPVQVFGAWADGVFGHNVTSPRGLLIHTAVTASSTLVGFAFGSLLGLVIAVGIVQVRVLEAGLLPWVIASQTIPILAIAPMVVVVLGAVGLTGLVPKAVIAMYLCFFPVTVGMVKGLRAADPLAMDLMRTYAATPGQIFWKLRFPASLPYLFASMRVAIAAALVGAIVGELPTGANMGLGARLLAGSYYGQTVQMWAALVMAAVLSVTLVFLVGRVEWLARKAMGGAA